VNRAPARLAIVDDHAKFRTVLREVIELMPEVAVTWESDDGLAALDRIASEPVDLVVIDLSLPGINGIDLIRRISERWPAVTTLVVTGHTEQTYVDEAFSAGARAYVLKGRPADLRAGIVAALADRRFTSPRVQAPDERRCTATPSSAPSSASTSVPPAAPQ
jgi:DNA-binding NarL/FixJ family response regulator